MFAKLLAKRPALFVSPVTNVTSETDVRAQLDTMKMPKKQMTMEDRIADGAIEVGPFKYISLSASASRSSSELFDSVRSARRAIRVDPITGLQQIPPIVCKEWHMSWNLAQAVPPNLLKKSSPWITLDEILVYYTPAQSAMDSFSVIQFTLLDRRKTYGPDQKVRSAKLNSNYGADVRFSLDHSVHVDDIADIALEVELMNSPLSEGKAWGSLRILFAVSTSKECVSKSEEKTIAVTRAPDSAFWTRRHDPHHIDLTIKPSDMPDLQEMYTNHRIIDQSVPRARQKQTVSGSVAGSEDDDPYTPTAWRNKVASLQPPVDDDSTQPSGEDEESGSPIMAQVPPDVIEQARRTARATSVRFQT